MIRFRSYRTKLQTVLLLLGLGALGVAGWRTSEAASTALRIATYDRLTAIRETRARQIERYFLDLGNHVLALSSDEATISALESFATAAPPSMPADPTALRKHYDTSFRELHAREPKVRDRIADWFPEDPVTIALQHWFIARNPHPPDSRSHLLAVPEAGPYSGIHARYHPTLQRYLTAFGFYDIFLIGSGEGRVFYTVTKEVDLGTKLTEQPYSQTTLASAWRRAMALPEPESFVVEDYAPYLPSSLAPAAFVAAPVYRAGNKIGALAIQLSIAEINRIMTGERRWIQEGLGRTGQAFLIGNDGSLRSDVRHEIEQPAQFSRELEAAGVPHETVDRIRRYRTAVFNLKVTPGNPQRATGIATDFRGVRVLRSEAPLALAGLTWMVVAEIEAAEALAPIGELRFQLLWQAVLLAMLLALTASFLGRSVTLPLLRLAGGARRLGRRDFSVRLPVESSDEIGELAASFNSMAEELERTTVSRQELDRMLSSLINAVFVIEGPHATVDDVLDAPVRDVNRAGRELLTLGSSRMNFRDLLPPGSIGEWRGRIAALLSESKLPAQAATLRASDGTHIPVLFSASRLTEEHGQHPGLICVAQDISEWKIAQDKLRRMSKVFMDSTDPIVLARANGRIANCNLEAEQTYGWKLRELEGREMDVLFTDARQLRNCLQRCLQGEAVRNVEMVQLDSRGREFPALVTLSVLTDQDGMADGVAAICKDITERKRAEEAIRQKQAALEVLTARLIKAQEEERSRLARELHDNLSQQLASIAIDAGRLERIPPGEADRWRAMLDRIKRRMANLSMEVHGLSRRLHPSMLDDLGLAAAIESECRAFFERGGTPVEFSPNGDLPPLPKETTLGLYRIVQEALWNISKHAAADEVRIALHLDGAAIRLNIADTGRGFDRNAPGWRAGMGLASMEERARLLGGTFAVRSAPGQGTEIEVTAPVRVNNDEAENSAGGRP